MTRNTSVMHNYNYNWYSMPISIHSLAFNTLSALSISHAAYSALALPTILEPSGSKIQLKDHKHLPDLPLIPLPIVFFNKILNSSKLWNSFNYFCHHKWKWAKRSFQPHKWPQCPNFFCCWNFTSLTKECILCVSQVPFTFESEQLNGNLMTK